ncbi:hypothetical protein LXA43DRAFT_1134782 [Ganoderma leucocontextum]|nr:hypothetical protein LXA43DRAFT_1134782 [Ganoderma leucocontextum]
MVEFDRLNDDVLVYLLGLILQADESSSRVALVPLSSTCRWLRDLSKPFIFRKIHRTIGIAPPTPQFFLPPSLWSYVHPPSHIPHLYVCGVFIGPVIKHILQQMPSLTKISLRTNIGVVHGPYWTFLQFALSLPRLREFEMTGLTFCPVVLPTETLEFDDGACAPLTAFRYEAVLSRGRKYALSVEKDALALVLEKIHHTLVTLTLPSEPAPISLLSLCEWPNLRELKLRGMRWAEPRTPLILLFANMPKLRSLALELVVPDDAAPEAIWPPGLPPDTAFPWPELEELTIANPDPDDELFAHLPPCIRALALPSRPRRCVKEWLWKYERRYHLFPHTFHLMTASNLLGVLERCSASGLKRLEIEYGADERERDLLRYLATAFQDLSSLTLYRYRGSEETVVRVEDIVHPLAPLTRLQTLCLNLDLETRPARTFSGGHRGGVDLYAADALDQFSETLEDVALVLARSLTPSLQRLSLWMPSNRGGPVSTNFSVFRDGSGKEGGPRIRREAFTCHEREDVWGI